MSNTKKAKSNTTKVWTLKGVENETRSKVTKAAKKSGVTIGSYVNRVLLEAANNDLSRKKISEVPAKMEDLQAQMSSMNDAIVQIADKLNQPKATIWKRIFG